MATNERFQPYVFKNEKTSPNRVVVPPMASQTADENGFATDRTVEHYRRLSASRAGIVFVEYSYVHPSGKGEEGQLGVDSDEKIFGLSRIASAIHQAGALAGLQLVHVGGKTTEAIAGGPLMAPSAVAVPVKGWEPPVPSPMTEAQIETWIESFTQAARRAQLAGYDLVELHAAHGYGLNQWLSPLTNQRTDQFGGDAQGRSALLFAIVDQVKKQFPELLLAVRLPAQDHMPGGLTITDMARVAHGLEARGLDLIDVSSGIGGWRRPEGRSGEGYLVGDASALKAHLSVPVVGVGGIETGAFIDQAIRARALDFAAVGRAILRDPQTWGATQLTVETIKCFKEECL